MMKKWLIILGIAALLVVAQGPLPLDDPCALVSYVMTSVGTNFIVGVIVSGLVEYWPAWAGFDHKAKRPILLGLCLIVPFVGLAVGIQLCSLAWETWWWTCLVAGGSAFVGSQMAHIRTLSSGGR